VHDDGIVLAREDITGAPHVGGKLVNLVKFAVDRIATVRWLAQIHNDEVIGLGLRILRELKIHTPHPKPIALQALYEMRSDKPTCTAH
jgi:hypothetical protein